MVKYDSFSLSAASRQISSHSSKNTSRCASRNVENRKLKVLKFSIHESFKFFSNFWIFTRRASQNVLRYQNSLQKPTIHYGASFDSCGYAIEILSSRYFQIYFNSFFIHAILFLRTNHSSIGGSSDRGGNQGSPRLHRKSPHFLRGESQRLCSLEEDVRDDSFFILT